MRLDISHAMCTKVVPVFFFLEYKETRCIDDAKWTAKLLLLHFLWPNIQYTALVQTVHLSIANYFHDHL